MWLNNGGWFVVQLGKVLETLKQQLESKGRELQEFREKHNIQLRGEDDAAKTAANTAASSSAKTSGVLVAASGSSS